jgi:hypothetical protein
MLAREQGSKENGISNFATPFIKYNSKKLDKMFDIAKVCKVAVYQKAKRM